MPEKGLLSRMQMGAMAPIRRCLAECSREPIRCIPWFQDFVLLIAIMMSNCVGARLTERNPHDRRIRPQAVRFRQRRRVRSYQPRVEAINALEPELAKLSDDALRARTDAFKKEVAEGKSLDDILVPAFATVREAAKRTLGQRHFDVQLIGGMILHEGRIAEMKTGEGKTLVATLPVYLNALAGRGVHVVTVNDYLAKRDAEWMGQIYKFPRPHRRRHRARPRRRAAQEGLRLRRHLRHQ